MNQEEMTVEQIWQYGTELGSSHLATYLSGIQYLGDNHFLINFGGQVFDENGNASYINSDGVSGHSASIQYEIKNGEIIYASSFEISGVSGNMYRAERHDPYFTDYQLNIFQTSSRYGNLPARNLLTETTFEENNHDIQILSTSVVNDGVQLALNLTLAEVAEDEQVQLFFKGDKNTFSWDLGTGTAKITKYLSLWEIPEGDYELYLQVGENTCDLNTYFQQDSQEEFSVKLSSNEEAPVVSVSRNSGEHAFLGEVFLYFWLILGCSWMLLYKRNSEVVQ